MNEEPFAYTGQEVMKAWTGPWRCGREVVGFGSLTGGWQKRAFFDRLHWGRGGEGEDRRRFQVSGVSTGKMVATYWSEEHWQRRTSEAEDQWTGFEPVKCERLRPPNAVAKEARLEYASLESYSQPHTYPLPPIAFSQTFLWTVWNPCPVINKCLYFLSLLCPQPHLLLLSLFQFLTHPHWFLIPTPTCFLYSPSHSN